MNSIDKMKQTRNSGNNTTLIGTSCWAILLESPTRWKFEAWIPFIRCEKKTIKWRCFCDILTWYSLRYFSRNFKIWNLNCVWQYTHRYSSKSRWIGPHSPYRERSTFIAVDKNCIKYKHNSPAFHLEVNKPHTSSPCHISPSVETQSLHERPSPCQPTVSWAQARFWLRWVSSGSKRARIRVPVTMVLYPVS